MGPTKSLTFSPGDLRVAMLLLDGGFNHFYFHPETLEEDDAATLTSIHAKWCLQRKNTPAKKKNVYTSGTRPFPLGFASHKVIFFTDWDHMG